jgi:hypothetical protein
MFVGYRIFLLVLHAAISTCDCIINCKACGKRVVMHIKDDTFGAYLSMVLKIGHFGK